MLQLKLTARNSYGNLITTFNEITNYHEKLTKTRCNINNEHLVMFQYSCL